MQEQEAIRRLQAGDIGGLETLVRLYQVPAVQAACLITRNRSLAEDIVQAAFLRVYERIGQFDASRPFKPWFLRSVVNDALKAANRAQRQVPLEATPESDGTYLDGDAWLAGADATPEEAVEAAELRDRLSAALDRLTPVQRVVIVQRYYLDLSESEMAGLLGCPPGTVKSRLNSARTKLRRLLSRLYAPAG